MKYRKLRIVWSVGWGLVAVLLCLLWVRSYSSLDGFAGQINGSELSALNEKGQLRIAWVVDLSDRTYPSDPRWHRSYDRTLWQNNHIKVFVPKGLLAASSSAGLVIWVSHWLAVLLAASLAAFAWLPWSMGFSLRAFLLAITLGSIVLGLVVWAVRG